MGFLSDLGDQLFGEEPSVEHSQQPKMTPEQLQLLQQLITQFGSNPDMAEMAQGTKPFTGQMAPSGPSKLEGLSLAAMEQQAMNMVSPGGDPLNAQAEGALSRGMASDKFDQAGFDKFFGEAVAAPMLDLFKRDVIPELTRRFSGSAAFGSDRMTAERTATDDLGKNLAAQRSGMAFKTSEAGKDRSIQAAGMVPGQQTSKSNQLMNLLQGGSVPRGIEATKLTADYNEFVRQQTQKSKAMERALALLGIQPIENTTVVNPGSPGLLQGVATGAGMGLGKWLTAGMA